MYDPDAGKTDKGGQANIMRATHTNGAPFGPADINTSYQNKHGSPKWYRHKELY
jgi:hypothetical protein